jgi:hypothetical protein
MGTVLQDENISRDLLQKVQTVNTSCTGHLKLVETVKRGGCAAFNSLTKMGKPYPTIRTHSVEYRGCTSR